MTREILLDNPITTNVNNKDIDAFIVESTTVRVGR